MIVKIAFLTQQRSFLQ